MTVKQTDRRLTPEWVLAAVREMAGGPIALDVCTESDNPTAAKGWLTIEDDALRPDWSDLLNDIAVAWRHADWLPIGWMNHPWSNPIPWARRWAEARGTWLCFSGVDYTTEWWHELDHASAARCELHTRPRCPNPETGRPMEVARSATVWLRTDSLRALARFKAAFEHLGRVVQL